MTLFTPEDTAVTFMTGFNTSTSLYEAAVYSSLPGAEPYNGIFRCDPRVPEEMAAFYDDLVHDSRIWHELFLRALTDRCTYQVPLF